MNYNNFTSHNNFAKIIDIPLFLEFLHFYFFYLLSFMNFLEKCLGNTVFSNSKLSLFYRIKFSIIFSFKSLLSLHANRLNTSQSSKYASQSFQILKSQNRQKIEITWKYGQILYGRIHQKKQFHFK